MTFESATVTISLVAASVAAIICVFNLTSCLNSCVYMWTENKKDILRMTWQQKEKEDGRTRPGQL